jgi:NAD+ diphosphatase
MPDRPLTFADGHHERATEHRHDQNWLDLHWSGADSSTLVVCADEIEVTETGGPRWMRTDLAPSGEQYLLGLTQSGQARYAVAVENQRESASYAGLRSLVAGDGEGDADWLCHAVALSQWHRSHQFCPRCGHATEVTAGGAERRCPADGSEHFPRVDPAVIVLVTDADDRALLGRQDVWPVGRFSTLAGFVEPGESAEQAVVREVFEESAVSVESVQLLATQPWPFPSSLMIGASARAAGSPIPRADGEELSEVRWFTRSELRDAVADEKVMVPGPISISRWLIDRWFGDELPDDRLGWR